MSVIVGGDCDLKSGSRCRFCRLKACLAVFPPREYMSRFKSGMVSRDIMMLISTGDFLFLSTPADRQGVDISFTVCLFVQLRISPPKIKLAASNFVWRFMASKEGMSHFCEFCFPRGPKSDESASARAMPTRM